MALLSAFDRTNEFQLTANTMKSSNRTSSLVKSVTVPSERLEYLNYTQELARKLSLLGLRIEKLSELVASSTLFNDKAKEMETLFSEVAAELRTACQEYENLSSTFSTLLTGGRNQSKIHCLSISDYLNSQISIVSDQFKSVLRQRSAKQQAQRAKLQFLADDDNIPSTFPTSVVGNDPGLNCPALLRAQNSVKHSPGNVVVDLSQMGEADSRNRALHQEAILENIQEQQHAMDMQAVNQVNIKLQEMTSMFQHIANLVSEQGEQITRIDMNVAETENFVEQGYHELLKYFTSITKNRWFYVKLFAVFAIFLLIFVSIF